MIDQKTGGPAFPSEHSSNSPAPNGMTLRDYFAGKSITGTLCGGGFNDQERLERAKLAYKMADAMLEARK